MFEPTPRFEITWRLDKLPHSVPAIATAESDNSYLILINEELSETERSAVLKKQIEAINNGLPYLDNVTVLEKDTTN